MIQKDKYMHAAVCAAITLLTVILFAVMHESILAASIAGFLTAMAAGLAKEYGDSCNPYNKWDWYDVVADAAGSIIMLILVNIAYIIVV